MLRSWSPFFMAALGLMSITPSSVSAEPKPYSRPSLNPSGIESAFIASQGDYFAYVAAFSFQADIGGSGNSVASPPARQWQSDGSAGVGLGLGSSTRSVALQLGYNITSLRGDQVSGSVDVKVARDLVRNDHLRVAVGAGLLDLYTHGSAAPNGPSPFVVSTIAIPLLRQESRRTLQFNLGYGGGKFQDLGSLDLLERGVFASVGVEVADNVGLSMGWGGRGLNATMNVTPLRGIPLAIGASAINLTNHDRLGRAAVLFLTWGGSFQTASF